MANQPLLKNRFRMEMFENMWVGLKQHRLTTIWRKEIYLAVPNSVTGDPQENTYCSEKTLTTNGKERCRAALVPFLLGFALAISLSAILLVLSNVRDSISNPDQNSHEYTTYANIQDQVNIPLVSAPHRDKPWAGVVLPIAPAGSKRFAATKASVTLPRYYNATGIGAGADRDAKRQRWRIAATVGIGARSSNKAYLQAGVNIDADPMTGKLSFEAWYQWWPDVRRHLPLDLMPGADVTMEVVMFNATVGKAVIRNDSLRQYNTQFLHPPTPEALLEGHDAEWLVESGEDSEPFDFGVVSFRQCVAYTEQQVMVVAGHGDTYDMHYGGVIQANVRSDNASVDVAYTASH